MRVQFEESATDMVSLYVCGIYIMLIMNLISKPKVKVQFNLEQATKAQRVSRGIAVLFP
jgi:hypothetical protein